MCYELYVASVADNADSRGKEFYMRVRLGMSLMSTAVVLGVAVPLMATQEGWPKMLR